MNARNLSTAVMARRAEPADSLDFFPTPPWATRGFAEYVMPRIWTGPDVYDCDVADPACGEGHMAAALAEYFAGVEASDIFPYGFGRVADFLHPDFRMREVGWVFTNPPFNQAAEFIRQAMNFATRGVAMLVRTQFQEGDGRYQQIFRRMRPQHIFQYVERVPMHRGRWVINGKSATAYCWVVWRKHPPHDQIGRTLYDWIPKSRTACSRPDDWLRFGGCMDLPKEHAVHRAIERLEQEAKAAGRRIAPVRTIKQVRAEQERLARPAPASIGDIRREMERLL